MTASRPQSPETHGVPDSSGGGSAADTASDLNLFDPEFMGTAFEKYARLRETGPVVPITIGIGQVQAEFAETQGRFRPQPTYFVSHYDAVVEALLSDKLSVDPRSVMSQEQKARMPPVPEEFRPLAQSLLGIDPPDHTRIRKLVQPSFTGRGLAAMRQRIQAAADDLLDKAEAVAAARGETAPDRTMELVQDFAYPFPVTVISDLLGIPAEDRGLLQGWTANLLRIDNHRVAATEDASRVRLREFIDYLKELFARKRRDPTDDMISRMVMIEEDGDTLTEDETLATVFLMFLAGHITTVNLVANGVVALLSHPAALSQMRADPSRAKNMVEESLRYWGPIDFVSRRYVTEDVDLAGTPLTRGEQVTISLAAANRDPEKFDNPDAFDIERDDANRHVAFGKGIHVCLGAPLARIEAEVAFETLVRRYPDMRLAVPLEDIAWGVGIFRGFREVPLLF